MKINENEKQILFELIEKEYHKAFLEILDGTLTEIPVGNGKTKKVFPKKSTGNWGLTTCRPRKRTGGAGDPTTPMRLKKMSDLGLFSEEDFNSHEGNLKKEVQYNSSDAKYIMIFLYNRVVKSWKNHNILEECLDLGLEEYGFFKEEGGQVQVTVNRYERNGRIRKAFLKTKKGNYSCEVCGFDFKSVYGELGKDFIHVHHKIPLYLIGKSYHPDIENDFALVCPNCHAMLHRNRKEPLSVEELRKILSKQCNSSGNH